MRQITVLSQIKEDFRFKVDQFHIYYHLFSLKWRVFISVFGFKPT